MKKNKEVYHPPSHKDTEKQIKQIRKKKEELCEVCKGEGIYTHDPYAPRGSRTKVCWDCRK